MRLIANKPCSYGGQQFYIGDEIPAELVADAKAQEKLGVITIVNDGIGVPDGQPGTLFTLEQVEKMVAEAVDEAVDNTVKDMMKEQERLQAYVAELKEMAPGAYDGTVQIDVKGASNGQFISIPALPEEIQQVFSILQMNADEGVREIADVESENVLILLHAADGRSTVKNAAKKQADKLFPAVAGQNGASNGNGTTGANMEGADT